VKVSELVRENMSEDIWIEKYRPKAFSEIKGQDKIVERAKAFVEQKNMPNLLFAGPAGVGKSTLALVIAHALFGDNYKSDFLELNASDDRGIDVVRSTIKDFAKIRSLGGGFKIIFLDECDSLTKEAQQALRRTMENYSSSVRFILSCNFSTKLIEPIQSRCTVFRFKPLQREAIKDIIDNISKRENLKIKAFEALYDISEGDARRVENVLQSCAAISKEITDELVYEIVAKARPKEIRKVLEAAVEGDFVKSRELLTDVMVNHGLSGLDVIKQVQKAVWDLEIDDKRKIKMIERCGEIEFRLVEGSDEFIQLEALLAGFISLK
jgi:replication factor C small subunit